MFLAHDRPDFVEDSRPQSPDALGHGRLVQPAGRNGDMYPRMEQKPPQDEQYLRLRFVAEGAGVGLLEQDDGFGQLAVRRQTQFGTVGDLEQGVPADDVRLVMRHAKAETRQTAVLFDDPAQDAGRYQQCGGVRPRHGGSQAGEVKGGRGDGHRGSPQDAGVSSSYPRRESTTTDATAKRRVFFGVRAA